MGEMDVCPFCGGADLEPDWTCALVRCRTCQAEGPVVGWAGTTEERRTAAIAAWNRRSTPPDDLRAELVAVCREALECYDTCAPNETVCPDCAGRLRAVLAKVDSAGEGRGT